jgi:hypothetical protein
MRGKGGKSDKESDVRSVIAVFVDVASFLLCSGNKA